jgi:hypothetical protein
LSSTTAGKSDGLGLIELLDDPIDGGDAVGALGHDDQPPGIRYRLEGKLAGQASHALRGSGRGCRRGADPRRTVRLRRRPSGPGRRAGLGEEAVEDVGDLDRIGAQVVDLGHHGLGRQRLVPELIELVLDLLQDRLVGNDGDGVLLRVWP